MISSRTCAGNPFLTSGGISAVGTNTTTNQNDLPTNNATTSVNSHDFEFPKLSQDAYRPQPASEVPVLIIGGEPVGLLAGILLAQRGITSVVLERHARRLGQPKAHALNPRSLEILRQTGLDTEHLRRLGASAADADAVRFVLSVKGLEVGSLPYERQDEAVKELTPEPLFNIAQPILEEYLWKEALDTGLVTIWREWQWQACSELEDKMIQSTVLDRNSGREIQITSKYLLGCDGAHACSRRVFQIPFETLDGRPPAPIHYVSINLLADLSKENTGTLWFIMTKTAGKRNFIAYDRSSNWVFVTTYNPLETPGETFNEEYCRSLIDQSLGEKTEYKVIGITLWNTTPHVAKYYRSRSIRNGFLAGDAAHCFPSTGGLGINTGIGDIHNLVWKIDSVKSGLATDDLLDSYEVERIPIALANSRQSRANEAKIHSLGRAIFGTSGTTVEERMDDPKSRREIEEALKDNADHFNSLDLQIGFVYGTPRSATKSVSNFKPECVPGARLPHAWIVSGGRRISTLDLVGGNEFVLFASRCFGKYQGISSRRLNVRMVQLGVDIIDEEGMWSSLMGLGKGSKAVLVRPDQHILTSGESMDEVLSFLRAYLHQ